MAQPDQLVLYCLSLEPEPGVAHLAFQTPSQLREWMQFISYLLSKQINIQQNPDGFRAMINQKIEESAPASVFTFNIMLLGSLVAPFNLLPNMLNVMASIATLPDNTIWQAAGAFASMTMNEPLFFPARNTEAYKTLVNHYWPKFKLPLIVDLVLPLLYLYPQKSSPSVGPDHSRNADTSINSKKTKVNQETLTTNDSQTPKRKVAKYEVQGNHQQASDVQAPEEQNLADGRNPPHPASRCVSPLCKAFCNKMRGFVDLDKSIRDPDGATYVQCSLCQVKMDPYVRRPRLNIPLRDHPPPGKAYCSKMARFIPLANFKHHLNGSLYGQCEICRKTLTEDNKKRRPKHCKGELENGRLGNEA